MTKKGTCWPGYHRVAGTKQGTPGSCSKNKFNMKSRQSKKRGTRQSKKRGTRQSKKRGTRQSKKRGTKSCKPTGNKRSAKIINGKCVRFGYKPMPIKVNIPARRKSFCARHRCNKKRDKATAGYQSCKAWRCKTG